MFENIKGALLIAATATTLVTGVAACAPLAAASEAHPIATYGYEQVENTKIFFREAGDPSKPAIVLLHGFPKSSHQYRDLITLLADDFYLIAPDYPGFGASDAPARTDYTYSFDNIADTIDTFLEQKGIDQYSIFIQDYGAPVGLRIATEHPERIQAIITQNGNLYEEGLNEAAWAPIMKLWQGRDPELEASIAKNVFSFEGLKWQYTHGTRNPKAILPDNWILDHQRLSRPGQHEIQLDLFYDYRNNVAKYSEWQAYLREYQPPVLVVWGRNDAFFPVPGAEAFKRDVKDLDYNLLDTGHFALEEDGPLIAQKIRSFFAARDID
ncbi:MAG: alpha/beta hydrolase [Pseudomonadota bacterium]